MHRHSSPYLFVEVNLNVGQAERTRWSPCRHRACGNYSRVVALTFNFNLSISIASKGCFPAPGNAVASTPTSRSIAHPRRCRCRERKKKKTPCSQDLQFLGQDRCYQSSHGMCTIVDGNNSAKPKHGKQMTRHKIPVKWNFNFFITSFVLLPVRRISHRPIFRIFYGKNRRRADSRPWPPRQ